MHKSVFAGRDGLAEYLNPDHHALPLVELPPALNPFYAYRVRVLVKLMHHLPLGNVKSLPAYHMLAEKTSSTIHSIVEASSGNTVLSLAVTARAVHGVATTLAIASNEVERGKLNLLRLLGVQVRVVEEDICPDPADPSSAPNRARSQGANDGWWNPGQYHNEANPAAHARWTGPQIWEQTEGRVTVLAAGMGTCGTVTGTGSFLKRQRSSLHVIGAVRQPNNPVPGVRTEGLLREIEFEWSRVVDSLVRVGTVDAYRLSADCCRYGLLIGPSAGFALQALYQQVQQWLAGGKLEQYQNEDGEVVAVVISPDGPLAYLEEYFRYLPKDYFPAIENESLLKSVTSDSETLHVPRDLDRLSVYPQNLHALLQNRAPRLIDVREWSAFEDHHIRNAIWLPYVQMHEHLEVVLRSSLSSKDESLVIVCQFGAQSVALAGRAQQLGYTGVKSLFGGMIRWSELGLPRERPERCVVRS